MSGRTRFPWAAATLLLAASAGALGDDFDRLEGKALEAVPTAPGVTAHTSLTSEQIGTLPRVLREARAGLLVVRTGQGNLARMLVAPALRRPEDGGAPVPILVIERLDTFEAGGASNRIAAGRDVLLFDGFRLDLDVGAIVPDGQGGDVQFLTEGEGGPRLATLARATLYTLSQPPELPAAAPGRPTPGRAVVPEDFSGRYRLVANGQWTGDLELSADDQGQVQGRFRSDQTGSTYRVRGEVRREAPNQVRFSIQFPRSSLDLDGWLFTEGKGAIAGVARLLDRPFGFVAIRAGGTLAPEGAAAPEPDIEAGASITVALPADGPPRLDGAPIDEDRLAVALRDAAGEAGAFPTVRIEAAPAVPYERVARLLDLIRAAGAEDIRLKVLDQPAKPSRSQPNPQEPRDEADS
jgi:hypothetical protein